MNKLGNVFGGVTALGIGLVYVIIGLIFYFGSAFGLWFGSELLYSWGLWPLGALARLFFWITLGMGLLGIIGLIIIGAAAVFGVVDSLFEKSDA